MGLRRPGGIQGQTQPARPSLPTGLRGLTDCTSLREDRCQDEKNVRDGQTITITIWLQGGVVEAEEDRLGL